MCTNRIVVGTANRHVCIYDVRNLSEPEQVRARTRARTRARGLARATAAGVGVRARDRVRDCVSVTVCPSP